MCLVVFDNLFYRGLLSSGCLLASRCCVCLDVFVFKNLFSRGRLTSGSLFATSSVFLSVCVNICCLAIGCLSDSLFATRSAFVCV